MKTVVWIVLIIVLSSLIVFVGCKNKGDIMDGPDMVNNQEELPPPTDGPGMVKPEEPKEEGEKYVKDHSFNFFIETSAKENKYVKDMFNNYSKVDSNLSKLPFIPEEYKPKYKIIN